MYRNMTYSKRDQMSKDRDQDWTLDIIQFQFPTHG